MRETDSEQEIHKRERGGKDDTEKERSRYREGEREGKKRKRG